MFLDLHDAANVEQSEFALRQETLVILAETLTVRANIVAENRIC